MQSPFIKPDFTRNILNISATLAEFLDCPNDKPVLPALLHELRRGYRNVVFLILDGLGMYPIRRNLKESAFLARNVGDVLTSVFPSTTTNATTTLLTNLCPMEHGWFGWSLYFPELRRPVDLFLDADSITGELIGRGHVRKLLPTEPFYKRAVTEYTTSVVVPSYWDNDDTNRYVWTTFGEMCDLIRDVCGKAGKQFVYAYCSEPDATMHRYGVTSDEARQVIGMLDSGLEALCASLPDTLFIITADHGQTDVTGCIELYKDSALMSMLAWPPYLEARAPAFKIKEDCRSSFPALFREKYGADFELFESGTLIRENYFGATEGGHAPLLGDYIAICKTHKVVQLTPRAHAFKGHHTSLTEEMEVPLIVIGNN